MDAPLLQIEGLHKAYELDGVTIQALRGIDLSNLRGATALTALMAMLLGLIWRQ